MLPLFSNMVAARNEHPRHGVVVRVLLDAGVNVNYCDREGDTALTIAAKTGNKEMVAAVVQAGAHLDTQNQNGDTALIIATRAGHQQVQDELIRFGADVEARNNAGETPISVASAKGHGAILLRLLSHGAKMGPETNLYRCWFQAARFGEVEVLGRANKTWLLCERA